MIRILSRERSPLNPPSLLKFFDPDDPSNDVIIDPNGIAGNDNNSTVIPKGSFSGCSVTGPDSCLGLTNGSGLATAFFEVSKQPGDNFRVIASMDKNYLDSLTLDGIDIRDPVTNEIIGIGTGIGGSDTRALGTSMLTVWRKLHIEVDSMGPVVGNQVPGTVENVVLLGSNQADLTLIPDLPIAGNPPFDLSNNRFENAKIYIENTPYPVISSTAVSNGKFKVKVDISVGVAIVPDRLFYLVDDDDFNSNNGQDLIGDEGENLVIPDLSLLQSSDDPDKNVYAPAYVIPIRDLSGEQSDVPFVLNSPTTKSMLQMNYRFDNKSSGTDPDFWTIYILGGYQYSTAKDNDPNAEDAALGRSDSIWSGQGVTIFNEASREAGQSNFINNAATTAHETGHLFGANDGEGGLMNQGAKRNSLKFDPVTLQKIRKKLFP